MAQSTINSILTHTADTHGIEQESARPTASEALPYALTHVPGLDQAVTYWTDVEIDRERICKVSGRASEPGRPWTPGVQHHTERQAV